MYWPRLRLTPEEERWNQKYYDPHKVGRGVLRRMYPGNLELTSTIRQPVFSFQISRRSRVFAFTAAGDVERFQVEIITSSGERHTAESVYLSQLIGGANEFPSTAPVGALVGVGAVPYIFEPNIVLMPNQTLSIRGLETEDIEAPAVDYRIDFVLHVWEFPGFPGSPL
jgi:hypothetical protein